MESEVDPVLARRERVLELVSVVVERRCRHDRLDVRVGDPPDPHERVAHLLLLLRSLRLVREILEATSAAHAEVRTGSFDASRACLEDALGGRLGEAALRLRHTRTDTIPGQPSANEHDESVQARDAVAAVRERVDLELELLPSPNGRGHSGQGSRGAIGANSSRLQGQALLRIDR